MNNTQQLASPVWKQLLDDAWNDGTFFSQQGNGAPPASSSIMNRVGRTFSDAQLVPLAPLALEPPARSSDFAPPPRSARDEQASAQRAPLAERNVLILSALSTDLPDAIDASVEHSEEIYALGELSRKRRRETIAASSSSFRSRLILDFETVYADLIQLVDKYSKMDRSLPLHTLPLEIMPLIMMIDDQVLLNRDQKKRLLDLFHCAKQCLPPSQKENPWLDLFCSYPEFNNFLIQILGEETFKELKDSFFVDEEEEPAFSRSVQRARAPRRNPSTFFDRDLADLKALLEQINKKSESGEFERQKKRDEIKQAINRKLNRSFHQCAQLTDEQADRLVQLMVETGKKYPSSFHVRGHSFYDFCEKTLKSLLGPAKLKKLFGALIN